MINKNCKDCQHNSGDLVYIISPLTSQLRTNSRKVTIKYVGPLVIYKIVDPHNYLLMTLDGKILRGLFEHERLTPVIVRTSHGNVINLAQLKQVLTLIWLYRNGNFMTISTTINNLRSAKRTEKVTILFESIFRLIWNC